ncbi:MAG: DUF1553 domain-containing protein [Planctomycetes bacterium]|nr:DUF1553 domain-containing protein [Planctomycetota bacterium]
MPLARLRSVAVLLATLALAGLAARPPAQDDPHWAFVAPRRPALPATRSEPWVRQPIDAFVLEHLRAAGLAPSAEADRAALARRLALDLTGLPLPLERLDAFLADRDPRAFEALADELLASLEHAEHFALPWLDAARYADSNGYQHDGDRQAWPWRDWLIRGIHANRPLDAMVVEMLAGDLLPAATDEQRIATAFLRHHPLNDEGGAIAEEVRFTYVVDRANTVATSLLGLTMACAQCHDHKLDPITQREYYAFFAFFDDVDEDGRVDVRRRNGWHQYAIEAPFVDLATASERSALTAAAAARDRKEPGAEALLAALHERIPLVMVMADRAERRPTRLHVRGAYDQESGEPLTPDVPRALGGLPAGVRRDRLALARWLVSPENPLFARVMADRLWQTVFGAGLVATPEDFGRSGARPSHPELLDWLAVELVESGFDQRRLLRTLVTSATYRQSAHADPAAFAADPRNVWLARSARTRLSSFALRDQALALAGLLDRRAFGPPVFPYHPAGLWRDVSFDVFDYPAGRVDGLHRRTLYSFRRRTVQPPAQFDAAHRQSCVVAASRTNTPLHALVLQNEPGFVEAARGLAQRVLREAEDDEARLVRLWRLATARAPEPGEIAVLRAALGRASTRYATQPDDADALCALGVLPRAAGTDAVRVAAWTTLAQLVLSLDEVQCRP